MRVITRTFFEGIYLGGVHALGLLRNSAEGRQDLDYFRGLLTSGREFPCQPCGKVVRVCPRCQAETKWINSDLQKCDSCEMVFV
jgi:hypothetical protein